jgi:hypothetical protein
MAVWESATGYDPTLRLARGPTDVFWRKQLGASPFSRARLFDAMCTGSIQLMTGLKVGRHRRTRDAAAVVAAAMNRPDCKPIRVRVRTGPSGALKTMSVGGLVDRWQSGRSLVNVTDFHVRGTPLEREFDLTGLSEFNILCGQQRSIAEQEMMTMVVSSRGCVTDSHSDDPDGSNHCFTGRKLWLAWDTFEGRRGGLQDVERDDVYDRARFDMRTFLSLASSRWFVVEPGQTLFLPGDLTHKVITIEPYLGIGSFYVSLPNCVRTIARWIQHGPLWSVDDVRGRNRDLVDRIADAARMRTAWILDRSASIQRRWGLPFLRKSAAVWRAGSRPGLRRRIARHASFAALLNEAERVAP